jgi:hypothetical protein
MSRQFNPSITIYNRLNREIDRKPQQAEVKSKGLLSQRTDKIKPNMDEDINQPLTRVKQHVMSIRNYKGNRNA